MPEPTPSEVVIRVDIASICGTDVHIYDWDAWAAARIKVPLIQGHEFAGHVEKLGSGVTGFRKDDYVSAEGHIACGRCFMCRTGNAHVCKNVSILGIDRDGSFAEYMTVPASNVIVNDDDLPLDLATMQHPLDNAVYSASQAYRPCKLLSMYRIQGRLMHKTWMQMGVLLKSGNVNLKPILTHKFPLDDYNEAMGVMRSGNCGKVAFPMEA